MHFLFTAACPSVAANSRNLPVDRTRRTTALAKIPQVLHEHINTAFPNDVCLIGTVLPNGYAQMTPRGSTLVFDDEHFSLWERGKGSTTEHLADGSKRT